ncbi:hypothetical protein FB1_21630 [Flavobacterium branchiophilum NBRC 15030 = ATCC 35035]|nr:hypothetical protein FB1_21630 [Flavobacterium branchiophilum NBRC 15030 = ATCC 35035]
MLAILAFQKQNAQNTAVEKGVINVETGIFGAWISHEAKLGSEFALRSEFGLDAGLFGNAYSNGTGYIMVPVLKLEPRWYYNIDKRGHDSKNTLHNAANFLTLSVQYHPDWFVITNGSQTGIYNQVNLIPKWGIRRNIGKSNFNYEAGFGVGLRYVFLNATQNSAIKSETAVDVHLRIGYTFRNKK